ncbi:hypothetical protein BJ912DRAFT_921461 [Pholiota molesta]|nr:hypothetical protein BJ912DRAFT_921461 [Pholiota molesta]
MQPGCCSTTRNDGTGAVDIKGRPRKWESRQAIASIRHRSLSCPALALHAQVMDCTPAARRVFTTSQCDDAAGGVRVDDDASGQRDNASGPALSVKFLHEIRWSMLVTGGGDGDHWRLCTCSPCSTVPRTRRRCCQGHPKVEIPKITFFHYWWDCSWAAAAAVDALDANY